ncbi:MAG: hypothetical protein ACTSRZ_06240 [Promethearchaeota archaeon]
MTQDNSKFVTGNYSAKINFRNYGTSFTSKSLSQNIAGKYPNIQNNAKLSFNWYLEEFSDLGIDQDYIYVNVYLNNSRRLNYFIARYFENSSNIYCTNLTNHNTKGSWFFEYINITEDYINYFGSISQPIGINTLYFYIGQAKYRPYGNIFYLDNVSITIESTEYIGNGNFEVISPTTKEFNNWYSTDGMTSILKKSSFQGINILNITTKVNPLYSFRNRDSSLSLSSLFNSINPESYFINSNHKIYFKPKYYIYEEPQDNYFYSYFFLEFDSCSGPKYLQIFLSSSFWSGYSNSSNYIYIMLPNMTNSWYTPIIDLQSVLEAEFGPDNYNLSRYEFNMYVQGVYNESYTIFLRDAGIEMSLFFEDDFETGSIINLGWIRSSGASISYITAAYNGDYSANISKKEGFSYDQYVRQFSLNTMLVKGLSLEFYYNISKFTESQANYIEIELRLVNIFNGTEYFLNYIVAYRNIQMFNLNGTTSATKICFYANILNQWFKFEENIHNDFLYAFPFENTSEIMLYSFGINFYCNAGGEQLEILIDNLRLSSLIDPNAPQFISFEIFPTPLKSGIPITFIANVVDLESNVSSVSLFYSTDASNVWKSITMQENSSVTGQYFTVIDDLPEYAVITYYFSATDYYGNVAYSYHYYNAEYNVVYPKFSSWDFILFGVAALATTLLTLFITIKIIKYKRRKKRESQSSLEISETPLDKIATEKKNIKKSKKTSFSTKRNTKKSSKKKNSKNT